MTARTRTLSIPAKERGAVKRVRDVFKAGRDRTTRPQILVPGFDLSADLPKGFVDAVEKVAREFAAGRTVTITSVDADLTTQQAANMLGISRPFAATLMDRGDLPSYKVGNRRKVTQAAVESYRKKRDQKRRRLLQDMTDEAIELGQY